MREMDVGIDAEVVVRFCGNRALQQRLFYRHIGVYCISAHCLHNIPIIPQLSHLEHFLDG